MLPFCADEAFHVLIAPLENSFGSIPVRPKTAWVGSPPTGVRMPPRIAT